MNYKQGRITWCIILFFIFIFMLLFGINIVNKENILQSSYAVEIIDDITLKQKTISDYDCSIYITKAMLGQYIELHTINASVTASVDNKNIYEEEKVDAKNKELKYVCSRWHFIEIKPEYIGKEMIISLNTNNVIRENIKIYRGNLGNLILRLFKELLPEVILNSIILILSIIKWILHYLQKHNKIHTKPSNLWLCLGSVSFILFVMTPTIAMQLLVKNILLQYYMYYILLFLISLF